MVARDLSTNWSAKKNKRRNVSFFRASLHQDKQFWRFVNVCTVYDHRDNVFCDAFSDFWFNRSDSCNFDSFRFWRITSHRDRISVCMQDLLRTFGSIVVSNVHNALFKSSPSKQCDAAPAYGVSSFEPITHTSSVTQCLTLCVFHVNAYRWDTRIRHSNFSITPTNSAVCETRVRKFNTKQQHCSTFFFFLVFLFFYPNPHSHNYKR